MANERVKKSSYNMVAGFINQFVTLIFSFISRTVFIHTLGEEYLGLNGIFADVLNLLSMADLGFNTAMAYSFYKPLSEKNETALAALVNFYKRVYRVIAILVSVIGVAIIPFLKYIVNTEKEIPNLHIYYLFSLAGVVISYLFVYKTTILTADQKNYEVTKITIWTNLCKTVSQIVILLLTHNYILYLTINVLFQFLNNVIASRKAEKSYPYIKQETFISKEEEKSIFQNMKSVFLYKLSGTLFNATDNILISMIVGTAAVGLYSNYLMVSQKLLLIIQIIFSALTASIGNLIVKDNAEKRYEVFSAAQSVSFILCGIITSAFGLVANDLMRVWLGEAFVLPLHTVMALTLNTYLSCVLQPLWVYRDATGLYMKTKYIMLIGAALNIVLSITLGNIWGIAGIILASAIARLCTYFWYEPKLLFREYFERPVGQYYLDLLKNLLLVAMVIVVLGLTAQNFVIDSWSDLIVKGILIGAICCAVFMLVYVKSSGFQIIWNKAYSILNRKKKG